MARSSFIVCLSVFLFKVIPDSVQESGSSSTLISCQHAVIEWAEYNMPPLDLCHTACNETDKICVQISREHDQNNVSALCRDRRLTLQEVFLVYQHCQGQRTPCHLEAVPGLLGHMTATYKCLEDDIQVIDPCEEGSYRGTSVYFLYGYHRVVSSSSDVTCTCSLNKTNDTSDVHVSGVNVYSPTMADGLPVFAVEHDNKREHINVTFPKTFIITSRTALVSLTLTVSATHKIGRVWASVAQQGNSEFVVKCNAVDGTIPVFADGHGPLTPVMVGVGCLLGVLLVVAIVCLARRCSSAPTLCSRAASTDFLDMGYLPANFTVNRGAVARGVPDIFLRRSDVVSACLDTASITTSHDSAVCVADEDDAVETYLRRMYPYQACKHVDGQSPGATETASESCSIVYRSPDGLQLADAGDLGDARSRLVDEALNLSDVTDHLGPRVANAPARGNFGPKDFGDFDVNAWSDSDTSFENKPATASKPDPRVVHQKLSPYDLGKPRPIREEFSPVTAAKSTSAMWKKQTTSVYEPSRISSDANVYYSTWQNVDRAACLEGKMALDSVPNSENSGLDGEARVMHVGEATEAERTGFAVTPPAGETRTDDGERREGTKAGSACELTHSEVMACHSCQGPAGQSARSGLPQEASCPRHLHYDSVVLCFHSPLTVGWRAAPIAAVSAAGPVASLTRGRCQTVSQELGQKAEVPKGMEKQKYRPADGNGPLYDHVRHVGEDTYSSLNRGARRQAVIDHIYSRSFPHIVG